MAEEADNEDKTFDASPRRREEARQQGRFVFSQDLASSAMLIAGISGLMFLGPWMGSHFLSAFRTDLSDLFRPDLTTLNVKEMFATLFTRGLTIVGALLGILFLAAIAVGIMQAGFHISPERLEPNFEKLNPTNGFERLFSVSAIVKGFLATLKIIMLGWIAYTVLHGRGGLVLSLGHGSLESAADTAWRLIMRVALIMSSVLAVLGLSDYVYQYRKFEASLRMTREEFERENKEDDGDPRLKARRRQIARDRIRQRMLTNVPKSTVVITNPTHYAVALRYQQGVDAAPMVVAKGSGVFARRIIQLAKENNVPVMERPELARMLYKAVKEEQPIPTGLFLAVAEVIAFVYRLKGTIRQA